SRYAGQEYSSRVRRRHCAPFRSAASDVPAHATPHAAHAVSGRATNCRGVRRFFSGETAFRCKRTAGAARAIGRGMRSRGEKIRYAVVGAGNIAQVAVLPAFAHARENSELVALVSGDEEKRAALRERYGLELDGDYDDYESILERGRIDAVYIATPNSL